MGKRLSPTSNRAVAVVRVSTDNQARYGASIDTQDDAVQNYCQLRQLDLPPTRILNAKEGSSAKRPLSKRPEGQQLLAMIERGEVSHVVATKLDRLFRNTQDALKHISDWQKRGVALHIMQLGSNGPVDTSSTMGKFFVTMLSAVAELESGMIGDRIREVKDHLKREHKSYSAPPFGYEFAPDRFDKDRKIRNRALVPVPTEIETVRRIHRMRKQGSTLERIATTLNDKSVPTKRGGHWYPVTIQKILANQIYDAAH